MSLQLTVVIKRVIRASASSNLALKFGTARLPVLMARLILEGSRALIADKIGIVELLHDEAIHILTQVQVVAAVRAAIVTLLPLRDATSAAKLIALLAFLGLLHYLQTDSASEVLVKTYCGLLRGEVLICLDLST